MTSQSRHLLLVTIASLVVSSLWLVRGGTIFSPDSRSYLEPARSLASGKGYLSVEPFTYVHRGSSTKVGVDTIRPPVYPLLLAAFISLGLPLGSVIFLQIALNAVTNILIFLLARAILGSARLALAVVALRIFHLTTIIVTTQILTEALFTLVLTTACFLLIRRQSLSSSAIIGLLLSIATLARPVSLFCGVAASIAVIFAWQKRRVLAALILLALSFAGPLAWSVRNARASGVFTLSSVYDETFLLYKAAGALAVEGRSPVAGLTALQAQNDYHYVFSRFQRSLSSDWLEKVQREEGIDGRALSYAERAKRMRSFGIEIALEHWRESALLACSGVLYLLLGEWWEAGVTVGVDYRTAKAIGLPVAAVLAGLAGGGFVCLWQKKRAESVMVGLILSYFIATAAGPEAAPRYFAPVAGLYFIFVVAGAAALRERFATAGGVVPPAVTE